MYVVIVSYSNDSTFGNETTLSYYYSKVEALNKAKEQKNKNTANVVTLAEIITIPEEEKKLPFWKVPHRAPSNDGYAYD